MDFSTFGSDKLRSRPRFTKEHVQPPIPYSKLLLSDRSDEIINQGHHGRSEIFGTPPVSARETTSGFLKRIGLKKSTDSWDSMLSEPSYSCFNKTPRRQSLNSMMADVDLMMAARQKDIADIAVRTNLPYSIYKKASGCYPESDDDTSGDVPAKHAVEDYRTAVKYYGLTGAAAKPKSNKSTQVGIDALRSEIVKAASENSVQVEVLFARKDMKPSSSVIEMTAEVKTVSESSLEIEDQKSADVSESSLETEDQKFPDVSESSLETEDQKFPDVSESALETEDQKSADISETTLETEDQKSADVSESALETEDQKSADVSESSLETKDQKSPDVSESSLETEDQKSPDEIIRELEMKMGIGSIKEQSPCNDAGQGKETPKVYWDTSFGIIPRTAPAPAEDEFEAYFTSRPVTAVVKQPETTSSKKRRHRGGAYRIDASKLRPVTAPPKPANDKNDLSEKESDKNSSKVWCRFSKSKAADLPVSPKDDAIAKTLAWIKDSYLYRTHQKPYKPRPVISQNVIPTDSFVRYDPNFVPKKLNRPSIRDILESPIESLSLNTQAELPLDDLLAGGENIPSPGPSTHLTKRTKERQRATNRKGKRHTDNEAPVAQSGYEVYSALNGMEHSGDTVRVDSDLHKRFQGRKPMPKLNPNKGSSAPQNITTAIVLPIVYGRKFPKVIPRLAAPWYEEYTDNDDLEITPIIRGIAEEVAKTRRQD